VLRHQWIDEEIGPAGAVGGVVISELAAQRTGDRIANDARMCGLSLVGVIDEIKKRGGFGSTALQRKCAEKSAVAGQSRHILEEGMMGHTVEVVHAEADRGQHRALARRLVDSYA